MKAEPQKSILVGQSLYLFRVKTQHLNGINVVHLSTPFGADHDVTVVTHPSTVVSANGSAHCIDSSCDETIGAGGCMANTLSKLSFDSIGEAGPPSGGTLSPSGGRVFYRESDMVRPTSFG